MAATVVLLDNLPMPSTDGVGRVYYQLRDILGLAAEQHVESSLQRWAELSVLSPGYSKAGR
jgi:hypothetical protein